MPGFILWPLKGICVPSIKLVVSWTLSVWSLAIIRWFGGLLTDSSAGKESACSVRDLGLIPGLRRCPGEGKGYLLQYSGLENSMDCIDHGVAKSQRRLSDFHFWWLPVDEGYRSPPRKLARWYITQKSGFKPVSASFMYIYKQAPEQTSYNGQPAM